MEERYKDVYASGGTAAEAFYRIAKITGILREECPWDRAQTHESVRVCMLEEAYEACEAIDNNDMDNLEEELGDVLYQVLFHSILAEEASKFDIVSVINRECEKMIRRHPHVFAKENAKSVDKAIEKWENVKWKEKEYASYSERLEAVPKAMPALIRSYKIKRKAAEAGFDRNDAREAFQGIMEGVAALNEARLNGDAGRIKDGLGDLLLSVVDASCYLCVNPEEALDAATERFIKSFAAVEEARLKEECR